MDTGLEALATALYVTVDDLLIAHPEVTPPRPCVGLVARTSDAEIITLAVMQALLGYTSEQHWTRHAHRHRPGAQCSSRWTARPCAAPVAVIKPLRICWRPWTTTPERS